MSGYETLLEAAKADINTVDFGKLRMAYANSPAYDPYRPRADSYELLCGMLKDGDTKSIIECVTRILSEHYLDIEMHALASQLYEAVGDKRKAEYHARFAGGLFNSIMRSGDGRGFATALEVVDLAEEYAVMMVLDVEVETQELQKHEGHWFDVFKVHFPAGNQDVIYFNIDRLTRVWKGHKPSRDTSHRMDRSDLGSCDDKDPE